MSILGSLEVLLSLDNSSFKKSLDESQTKLGKLATGLAGVGGTVFAGAVAGVGALTAGLAKSVVASSEAENIQTQLSAVLASTGGIAGVTADRVNDLANKFSTITKYEDDAIVEGQNMLLTFTNIGEAGEIFDQTTAMMLDMSQAMGGDLPSTALQLGKALNNPTQGLTALTRVGVSFTEEQKNMIASLQEAGDMAGAQQIILDELKKEFGGSAAAAGQTFAGSMAIVKNSIGNIFETIGGKLLPVLTKSAQKLATWINAPETQGKIQKVADAVGGFAEKVSVFIPKAISIFSGLVNFLSKNQPIIIGVLVALGVAVGIWAVQTAIAGWAAITPFLPIIGILVAIAAVVALFVAAWKNNFGGIQDKTKAVGLAIQSIWNTYIKPPLIALWDFLKTYIFPIFVAIGRFVGAVFSIYFKILGGIINIFVIQPFKILFTWLSEKIFPIIQKLAGWVGQKLSPAFSVLKDILKTVAEWFGKVADKMKNLKLPSWLTPGSPFPFTISLIGLNQELQKSANSILPKFSAELNINKNMPLNGSFKSPQSTNNNQTINYDKIGKAISKHTDYQKLARIYRDVLARSY